MLQILELEALVPYFALTTYCKNLNNMPIQKFFKNTTFISSTKQLNTRQYHKFKFKFEVLRIYSKVFWPVSLKSKFTQKYFANHGGIYIT